MRARQVAGLLARPGARKRKMRFPCLIGLQLIAWSGLVSAADPTMSLDDLAEAITNKYDLIECSEFQDVARYDHGRLFGYVVGAQCNYEPDNKIDPFTKRQFFLLIYGVPNNGAASLVVIERFSTVPDRQVFLVHTDPTEYPAYTAEGWGAVAFLAFPVAIAAVVFLVALIFLWIPKSHRIKRRAAGSFRVKATKHQAAQTKSHWTINPDASGKKSD